MPKTRSSAPPRSPRPVDGRTAFLLVALALVVAVLGVFAPARRFEFVTFDDPDYVTQNPRVLAGLSLDGVAWAFTTGQAGNWHPVTWLSHMLDCALFGADAGAHHLVSVALHAANAVLLLALLARTTGALWRSAFVAALFALHPLHVESVAWVAERKDVLSTAFGLLAALAHAAYARSGRLLPYAMTSLLLALGLMAKPMLVSLPLVLLLLDLWPLGRWRGWGGPTRFSALVVEKIPLFALAVASSAVTLVVQRGAGATDPGAALSFAARAANAAVATVRYLALALWPADLAVLYPHPSLPGGTPLGAGAIVRSIALLLAITWLVFRWRERRYPLVGWLWYLVMLAPVAGFVQVGSQALADRYTYLPLCGIFVIAAWGAGDLAAARPRLRIAVAAACAVLVAASAVLARAQARVWTSSTTLYERALAVAPRAPVLHNNVAIALRQHGRDEEAVRHYRLALETDPGDAVANYNLGFLFHSRGELEAAIAHYRRAIERNPRYVKARLNLGIALKVRGELDQALEQDLAVLAIDPDLPDAHNNLGNVLQAQGRLEEAIGHYRRALEGRPDFALAHLNLGTALQASGRLQEAIGHYQEALRLRPDLQDARRRLEEARRTLGG